MEQGKQKQGKHFTEPARQKLLELCESFEFRNEVIKLRGEWGIYNLASSREEAHKYWQDLCNTDSKDEDYYTKYDRGETQHQKLQQSLEALCGQFGLSLDNWLVLFHIVLRFKLEKVLEEDILSLPLTPSLARVSIAPMNNRLYLDVTFATNKDIREIWGDVLYWQENVRPAHVKRGLVSNLLEGIKPGRPPIPDDICREAARLKDEEKWSYGKIGKHFRWKLQKSGYTSKGKGIIRSKCRTAEEAVKRGRKLR